VPDFTLTPRSALNGYDATFDGVTLREVLQLAIVSIAIPLGGEKKLQSALKKVFGIALPPVGKSIVASDEVTRILVMGRDQLFAVFPHDGADAQQVIAAKLGASAYSTDQSDVWVALEMSGPRARAALERICPIDLHPNAFVEGDVARTSMEHLGTIIVRTGADTFLLLSASSSAQSFQHALETSIQNIQSAQENK